MLSHSTSNPIHLLLLPLLLTTALALNQRSYYPTGDEAPTATVDSGVLIGKATSLPNALGPVNQFLGVPFASPPERFSPPQAQAYFHEPVNATEYKPACIQQFRCKYFICDSFVSVSLYL
jgi:acetylcholinesterase